MSDNGLAKQNSQGISRHGIDIVHIGLGKGLVPSGNNPSNEPMMTQVFIAIWCHKATMSYYWAVIWNMKPDTEIFNFHLWHTSY